MTSNNTSNIRNIFNILFNSDNIKSCSYFESEPYININYNENFDQYVVEVQTKRNNIDRYINLQVINSIGGSVVLEGIFYNTSGNKKYKYNPTKCNITILNNDTSPTGLFKILFYDDFLQQNKSYINSFIDFFYIKEINFTNFYIKGNLKINYIDMILNIRNILNNNNNNNNNN